MLDEHRTPGRYWVEAVNTNTTCHVGNQIFLRAFLNKTSYELMGLLGLGCMTTVGVERKDLGEGVLR
jgi:hypothetical protein